MNEFLNEESLRAAKEKAGYTSRRDLKNQPNKQKNRRRKGGEHDLFITTLLETNFKSLSSESKEIPLASSSK